MLSKMYRASTTSYVEDAVRFVELKREGLLCTVLCNITPEHKVRGKPYVVVAITNENKDEIVSSTCQDCAAPMGMSMVMIFFIMVSGVRERHTHRCCRKREAFRIESETTGHRNAEHVFWLIWIFHKCRLSRSWCITQTKNIASK